ncbi:MAG: NAD(P)/FAD-dependent oxidoreductase [Planctomycetota bacterium]
MPPKISVVGAGLAGLSCAVRLHRAGCDVELFESADAVGGRVRTDELDGFRLDRGFQVFLTSYPEALPLLDYDALQLRSFIAGADIQVDGRLHRFADPWRRPSDAVRTAFGPVAKFSDHFKVLGLRRRTTQPPVEEVLARPERSTRALLEEENFSSTIVERFFEPFYRGVFLERELDTSSRKFEFTFRMFANGLATLPRDGMGAIPAQLASRIPAERVHLGCRVTEITPNGLRLENGNSVASDAVVVATEERAAAALLGDPLPASDTPNSTRCDYYDAPESPIEDPILVLNGNGKGTINSVAVPSLLSDRYAPEGRHLVSVSTVGYSPEWTTETMTHELRDWFGEAVNGWRHLTTYSIPEALPSQPAGALEPPAKPARIRRGCYRCGDYLDLASINGAFASGRRAAEAILEDFA